MRNVFKFEITGEIPEGDDDAGAHAIVQTRDPAVNIAERLKELGMVNIKHSRTIQRKRTAKGAVEAETSPVLMESLAILAGRDTEASGDPAPHVFNLPGEALPGTDESVF